MISIFSEVWLGSAAGRLEQRAPVGLRLGLGAGVRSGHARLDPLGHQTLGLVHERLDHVVLGDDADDLAPDEQVTLLLAGGDPDVGLPGLAGAVDHAAHDRHLNGEAQLLEGLLGLLGHGDHVDLGPPARGACDEVEALAFTEAERLEQLAAGTGLLDRVGGERVADGVADSLGQEGPDARRALDQPARRRSRLGHPEVQRVVEGLRGQAVGRDHQRDR